MFERMKMTGVQYGLKMFNNRSKLDHILATH